MTNREKYTTAKERAKALQDFCLSHFHCESCPANNNGRGKCGLVWLELEAPLTAKEVANILAEHSKWRRGEGKYAGAKELGIALDRAVEILRRVKED